MPSTDHAAEAPSWRWKGRNETLLTWFGVFVVTLMVVVSAQYIASSTIWVFVLDAPRQTQDLVSRMFPPNWAYANRLWGSLWDTINMATLGTLVAVMISVPIAFLAARNTTPHPIFRSVALVIIVFTRTVNSLIWAIVLVTILGPGVLAGVIAVGIRAIGFISKLLYEAIEEINPEAIDSVTATGASKPQVILFGIVPQVLPAFAGIVIFRWDVNIRESTVVGLVGAGGIGMYINSAVTRLAWQDVSVIFVMILVLVIFSEWASARLRHAII
jgi:phosphonate transport system permease protein